MYEEDFVKEGVASFEIDGRKFKYLPTTAGIENDWLPQYMYLGNDGKPVHNAGKLNKLKLMRLTEVPYDVKKILNIEKDWKDLTDEQKWQILGSLNPGMFDKILIKITEIDRGDTTVKKN